MSSEPMVAQPDQQMQELLLRESPTLGKLAEALAQAQAEFPVIKRELEGTVEGQSKQSGKEYRFTYKYADLADVLAAVRPPLAKHGLAILQPIAWNGSPWLLTRLIHSSGEFIESRYKMGDHSKPQEMGSEITYARRYSLTSLIGIAADSDDDGAAAGKGGHRDQPALPACPTCKTNKRVIVSTRGSGYYCHECREAFLDRTEEGPRSETRTTKPATKSEPKAATPVPTDSTAEPPKAVMPPNGSKDWEDPTALLTECVRLGGSQENARTLLKNIASVTTGRGMKPDAVRAAWLALAKHPTFGGAK